ncbi:MAG: ATP-dependent helicase HrpB, partial [Alphaproteobacteria bacterium]|nr:ATP-dependent helicase HrpB [Alphaproteobacteria bacterium]
GVLAENDPLAGREFLAVASTDGRAGDSRIFLAAPLARGEIEALFADRIATVEEVAWDARSGSVVQRRQRRFGAVALEENRIEGADPARVAAAMAAGVAAMGLDVLPWTDAARGLQARTAFLARACPEADWPDLSDARLAETLGEWLAPYLAGMTRRAHLERLDLARILAALIPHPLRARLDALAPARLALPSGATYAIDYAAPGGPKLAVRLQEAFGLAETPRVAEGRVAVTLELLSPARRPLATTADLTSFWRQAYPQVRREMRGRYPKHAWPEDPLAAAPLAPRRIR